MMCSEEACALSEVGTLWSKSEIMQIDYSNDKILNAYKAQISVT